MPQQLMLFDDATFSRTGQLVLATRQIVFGVQFGDNDKLGSVYEFFADDAMADTFRQVMTEFIGVARLVHGINLPRVPRNSGILARLSEQREQLKTANQGQLALPPAVVTGEVVPPTPPNGAVEPWEGFWQTPKDRSNKTTIGKERTALRAEIRLWAIAQGLAKADDFGRGRIPTEIGMAWGRAHPTRVPAKTDGE